MIEEQSPLAEYVPGAIWLVEYPVRYGGLNFRSRMTVVRMNDGGLWLHSPCEIDAALKAMIDRLGDVRFIVGPGNFHWLHLAKARALYPNAGLYICPGIERKAPELAFDWFLGDRPPPVWEDEIDQVLVRGTRFIWELAFYHRRARTLILTDLVENIGDSTPGVGMGIKLWWKVVFRMWNTVGPAPEYQLGWKNKQAAKTSLSRILEWDFDRVVIAHGDLIDVDAKEKIRDAWNVPLNA